MNQPNADCPAWIRADDAKTEQLFRSVVNVSIARNKLKQTVQSSCQHEALNISDRH